jgi:MFS family permease
MLKLNKIGIRNLSILLGSTMTVMAGATIAPALPEMSLVFQDVPSADFLVKLVLTIPALLVAISAPFAGIALDRWGRKPILIASIILYGLTGTSGFVLDTLSNIIIGRALLGFAVAGIMTSFTTLISDYFTGEKLNQFMGYQAAVMGFGGVIFLLLGGYLADIGWQYPFLVYLFAFLILPGVLLTINEPKIKVDESTKISTQQTSALTLKSIALIYSLAFISMIIFYMIPVQLPFYLTELAGSSNSQVGVAMAIQALVAAVVSMQYQKFKARFTFEAISAIVFLMLGIGSIIISLSSDYIFVVLGLIIGGIGLGLLIPNFNVWLVSQVSATVRGKAVGGLTSAIFLGQFMSPIVIQPIIQQVGLVGAFGVGGGFLLFVAVLLFGIKQKNSTVKQQV